MKLSKKVVRYIENDLNEVLHTTLNPEGPGVVRIHLIPPSRVDGEMTAGIAIVNGQDIIPVNLSWTILLAEFIREVNKYSGREIAKEETEAILKNTCKSMRKLFPLLNKKMLRNDVYTIMKTFTQIAYGEEVDESITYINIGEYAPFMKAPHRMDLLVSAMKKNGSWHCNQKCVHCYAAGQTLSEEKEADTGEWKRIIDKCRKAWIPQLTFTGGEPTMREDLPELINYSKWFVTRLNTNGIKLTRDYCRKLKEASLDSMQITFYSSDEEIHNTLVGANQYQNTVQGIVNAIQEGLNVSINTPLCTINREYVKTLEFLREKGVRYVTCSGLITTGNAAESKSASLQLPGQQMQEILKEAVGYCRRNGLEISFTSPGQLPEEFFKEYGLMIPNCGACLSNMAITPSGNVVPCQSDLSGEPLGNMLTDSWESIWNSERCVQKRSYSAKMLGECPFRRWE